MFSNLPEELKSRPQWCIAAPNKSPHFVSDLGEISPASSTDSSTWMSFDKACYFAKHYSTHIGFMLSASDPFTCIDIDIKNSQNELDSKLWTSQEELNKSFELINAVNSYTEKSKSGVGFHIWIEGNIGKGARTKGYEVYSQERFIICTGDVHIANVVKPWGDLGVFVNWLRKSQAVLTELQEVAPVKSDADVIAAARASHNGVKFSALFDRCAFRELGYPSQSEADAAMVEFLAFHTPSNTQAIRLFRNSAMMRDKVDKRKNYIETMLQKSRSRLALNGGACNVVIDVDALCSTVKLPHPSVLVLQEQMQNTIQRINEAASINITKNYGENELPWPPGFLGQLAKYCFDNSRKQSQTISIVAAIGFMLGVVGQSYNISKGGLNNYIVLLAKSGVGKERLHEFKDDVINELHKYPEFTMVAQELDSRLRSGDFASANALYKNLSETSCRVHYWNEMGIALQAMKAELRSGKAGQSTLLKRAFTELYGKSGEGRVVSGLLYSKKENNVDNIIAPCLSVIGESVPSAFTDAIDASMLADGFISRLLILNYTGKRPHDNEETVEMSKSILAGLKRHVNAAQTGAVTKLGMTDEVLQLVRENARMCDTKINESDAEEIRSVWNRYNHKLIKLMGLSAASSFKTVCDITDYEWASAIVNASQETLVGFLESGEVDSYGIQPEQVVRKAIMETFGERENVVTTSQAVSTLKESLQGVNDAELHNIVARLEVQMSSPNGAGALIKAEMERCLKKPKREKTPMERDGVFLGSDLAAKLQGRRIFQSPNKTPYKMIKESLNVLVEAGQIMEVDKLTAWEQYHTRAICYRVV